MSLRSREKTGIIQWKNQLLNAKERHPMSLSGGEKQRLAIASAIASESQIFLFDELTSGLDFNHMKEVSSMLSRLKEKDKSIFVITHDPEFIRDCCTHIMHIENGGIVEHYPL